MTKSENENASSGNVLVHVDPPIRSFADKDTAPVTWLEDHLHSRSAIFESISNLHKIGSQVSPLTAIFLEHHRKVE